MFRLFSRLPLLHRVRQWPVVAVLTFGAGLLPPTALAADGDAPLPVVASFSILADMVREIGGENVDVIALVGRNSDPHSFEPSPQTIQKLADAKVVVSNGLGFEAWLPRVIQSAGFSGMHIVASDGVIPRLADPDAHEHTPGQAHQHGSNGVDPHAWHDLKNGMIYAENIADGLALADPARGPYYQRRLNKYLDKLRKLDDELRLALDAIPQNRRKAITAHDAFGYFGYAYGIEFMAAAGLATEAEPSAQEVAALVDMARRHPDVGIFTESATNPKLVEQLARETGAPIGGPLFSDALADADEPAGTYLGLFHWNAGQLISVLKPNTGKSPAASGLVADKPAE